MSGLEWKRAAGALLSWYRLHGRALPWRSSADPYAVLVSEFMLQQTRVETVIPYYERFLARFPTLEALAAAPLEQVLAAWEGLGYYRRARHLHAAAQVLVDVHGGRLPGDLAALRRLPGVGPYTAAALASIVYGRPVPALDGNIIRVMARILTEGGDVTRAATRRALAQGVAALQAHGHPGHINQALMELGAILCRPRSPGCARCPLQAVCRAFQAGDPEDFPARTARAPRPTEARAAALLVVCGRGVVLEQRPAHGLLAGLWELPAVVGHGPPAAAALARRFAAAGFAARPGRVLARRRWEFTHLTWDVELWRFEPLPGEGPGEGAAPPGGSGPFRIVPAERLAAFPMPVLMRRWLDSFGFAARKLPEL